MTKHGVKRIERPTVDPVAAELAAWGVPAARKPEQTLAALVAAIDVKMQSAGMTQEESDVEVPSRLWVALVELARRATND